ncbi:haloacid dehalogenase [Methanolobus mangrovi]|uniref:Haloacid dehalogenase n=1 Tax=Methanolobus mangrovi TaxID=3072977 RepID=A0AA51YIV8_9EURY|nr:haloacid dehalogenase [Methanolobus mangrovi]WMW21484.1 haloacid dehalogenase [Methanolobus mangrovi]
MINNISSRIKDKFEEKDKARESTLAISRDVVRNCRTAMYSIHKKDFKKASSLIEKAAEMLGKMNSLLQTHPDIYYAGFLEHAQQEFVECTIVYGILNKENEDGTIPGPEELNVSDVAYLNGLGDVSGELRRHILDLIRKGQPEEGESHLRLMEDIHNCLMMFDYPDAMTHGLRHKTDTTRSIIEKTRGDLTNAIRQQKLEKAMKEFESRIN